MTTSEVARGRVVVVGPYLGKDPCKHQCVWFTFTLLIQFKINLIVVHWSAEGFINYDCLFSVHHLRIAVHLVSCTRVRTKAGPQIGQPSNFPARPHQKLWRICTNYVDNYSSVVFAAFSSTEHCLSFLPKK